MWSLFKKKESESPPGQGLFDYTGEELPPLKFSNGKTQEDVVYEILDLIEKGNKIIFIHGTCGTGKSSIALNLARHFKKTSIVVPIKSLQKQYEEDYTEKMFINKNDNQRLKISVIKGRNNFKCLFSNTQCDDDELPCTIEIREKNMNLIKKYIEQNPHVSKFDFTNLKDVRRMSIAPSCPYWSPVLPSEVTAKALKDSNKKKYQSICGKEYALFQMKKGCGYYDQYEAYSDSDVLIFNSKKYLLEIAMGRKPKTQLDIIDECDEFLDSLANEEKINLNRLLMTLSNLFPETREQKNAIKQMIHLINKELFDSPNTSEPLKLQDTTMLDLFNEILANPYLAEDEDKNYYNNVVEIVKSFEHLVKETYISYDKTINETEKKQAVYVNLVSINLAQKFQDIINANNVLVLMSGTLHSEKVLKDIFGLDNFKIIKAETCTPGTITKYRTGKEKNCKYANFKSGQVTRKQYLEALDICIKNTKPPTLVHINAFKDLPTELEKAEYKLDNLISREKLKFLQQRDNQQVEKFKSGNIDLLFTTKCARGMDFPGEVCNSIIITKYPYPNTQSLFWKILRKEQPEKFTEFYMDKAHRELLQRIYRALRFKQDHVILLSPDVRVLMSNLLLCK